MTAQLLKILSHISFVLAMAFLLLLAVLFFALKIPKTIKEIKGSGKKDMDMKEKKPELKEEISYTGSEETMLLKDEETDDLYK